MPFAKSSCASGTQRAISVSDAVKFECSAAIGGYRHVESFVSALKPEIQLISCCMIINM